MLTPEKSTNGSNGSISSEATRLGGAPILATNKIVLRDQIAIAKPHVLRRDDVNILPTRQRFNQDWEVAKYRRFPIKVIEPVPELGTAVRVGAYSVWADPASSLAFYCLAVPVLRQFSLTVQKENRNNTIVISGGNAILEVSLFNEADPVEIERFRYLWTDALTQAGYPQQDWKFLPLQLRNLQASLELASNHGLQPPRTMSNSDLGRVTFLIDLSEVGVQIWKEALEQKRGSAIPGVCRLNTTVYAQKRTGVAVQQQDLSVSLGELLANVGAEAIVNANLQLSTEAKIVVEWHSSLSNIALNWVPNNGAVPGTYVFNSSAAPLSILLTSQDLNSLEVDWSAQVSFKDPSWMPIPESGKLTLKNNNFAHILKPSAWVRDYTLLLYLLDEQGNIISHGSNSGDLNNRLMGMMKCSASYLPNMLSQAFETSSQQIARLCFPILPGQPAELELTLVSQRNGRDDFQTRKLSIEDTLIAIKVYANARIEIVTNRDRVSESSVESEMLDLLAQLDQ